MDQLPLSTVIEAAMQRAESEKQLDYLFELIMTIEHLEACFELESADQ